MNLDHLREIKELKEQRKLGEKVLISYILKRTVSFRVGRLDWARLKNPF